MNAPRVGMSYLDRPEPLLSYVNGKERERLEKEVPFDASPLASEAEDDEIPEPTSEGPLKINGLVHGSHEESSDDERRKEARGDIKRTKFRPTDDKAKPRSNKRLRNSKGRDSIAEEFNETPPKSKRQKKEDDTARSRPTRTASSKTLPISGDHLKDEHGFTKRRNQANIKTFGSQKTASSQNSQNQPSSSKATQIKAPDPLSSPKKSQKNRIVAPKSSIPSSPVKGPPARLKKGSQNEDSNRNSTSPEPKPTFKHLPSGSQGSQTTEKKPESKRPKAKWQEPQPGQIITEKEKKKKSENPPESPRATFMMPADLLDFGADDHKHDHDDAYSLPSDIENLSDDTQASEAAEAAEAAAEETRTGTVTTCPWCGDPVEEAVLKDFSRGRRMNVKLRREFCQKHKKEAAKDLWRSRHYPTIQWDNLEDRFEEHREFLLGIIRGDSSHFRKIFAEDVDSGKAARTLQKENNLNPGYYGTRGFNVMCDYFSSDGEYSDLLKDKAVSDRAISGRGTPAFVQRVLVAELAVRLIQEDMDVSGREAREIMEESKAVGELIHGQN